MVTETRNPTPNLFMGITLQIQRFAATHRQQIYDIFHIGEISFAVMATLAVVIAVLRPEYQLPLFLIGPKLGELAAIMLCITLLPGILGRLALFPIPRATLMMYRRHLGITTYMLAVAHSTYTYWLPSFTYGFSPLRSFQVFGILALLMGLPLFLTSNDYSVRVMQKLWHTVHKLVYCMLLFAMCHTLLIEIGGMSVLLAGFALLELVSFLVQYIRAHTTSRG